MNQSPPTEKQTGKRIVSKGEYMLVQGRRAGVGLLGVSFYTIAVVFGVATIFLVAVLILMANRPGIFFPGEGEGFAIFYFLPFCFLAACIAPMASYLFRKWGLNMMRSAADADIGVPLTRANTADLPAPDSLVRASEEPVQEQEAVLLRAATEVQETPPEQLVRPVGGADQI